MSIIMDDVNTEVTPQDDPSASEKTVPYARFKEVNEKVKELEVQLKTKSDSPDDTLLEKKVSDILSKMELSKSSAQKEAEKQVKAEIDEILEVYVDVDKKDFSKFINDNKEKYSIQSVQGAMTLYRDLNNMSADIAQKTKDSLKSKPSFPKNEGQTPASNVDDSKKTYEQITEEVIREAEKNK